MTAAVAAADSVVRAENQSPGNLERRHGEPLGTLAEELE